MNVKPLGRKNPHLMFVTAVLLFLILLSGCNSMAGRNNLPELQPLNLLSDDCAVIASIPVKENQKLLETIIQEKFPDLKKDDASKLLSYFTKIYAGITTENNQFKTQLAGNCNISRIAINAAFSKKNGWTREMYTAASAEEALLQNFPNKFEYYYNQQAETSVSFPEPNLFCLSDNIFPMLEKASLRENPEENEIRQKLTDNNVNISFYVKDTAVFLQKLLNLKKITLGMKYITGEMISSDENYLLNLEIVLSEKKVVKPFMILIGISAKYLEAEISQKDEITVELKNLKLTKERLVSFFQ